MRHCHARGGGPPRERAVHVEMSWRAVDFHRRARLGRGREQRIEVDVEAGDAPAIDSRDA